MADERKYPVGIQTFSEIIRGGYVTIKDYDREVESYTLAIPNQEVRIGYIKGLMPAFTGLDEADVQMGFAAKWNGLSKQKTEHTFYHKKQNTYETNIISFSSRHG